MPERRIHREERGWDPSFGQGAVRCAAAARNAACVGKYACWGDLAATTRTYLPAGPLQQHAEHVESGPVESLHCYRVC